MKPFPRYKILTNKVPPVDITKDISNTQKSVTPRKHVKRKTCKDKLAMIKVPKIGMCYQQTRLTMLISPQNM